MVVGLFTGLLNHGGIERMGRQMAVVLVNYAQETGNPCRMLTLNDPLGTHRVQVEGVSFDLQGFHRNKFLFVWTLVKCIFKIRLLFLAHPNLSPLAFLFRCLRPRIPFYVATYGIDIWYPLSFYHRWALRMAKKVVTISRFSYKKLTDVQGVKSGQISILSPAIDKNFVEAASKCTETRSPILERRRILTVSRLSTSDGYKGIDVVIRSLPQVLGSIPDVEYVIVGDGDDRVRLERIADEVGVKNRVLFEGKVDDSELHNYYRNCDVFVMPSLNEGFGIVFLEAMAFKKPVVGGNHGGTPDVIIPWETGCLVEYGDVKGLTNCLIQLLQNEELRKKLGEAGCLAVKTQFSFERFKEKFAFILNENVAEGQI